MATARFRLHGELAGFLKREHRGRAFVHACARAANLKNALEAIGVPHTELGRITVNGAPATLQRTVREGDEIEAFPVQAQTWQMGTVPIFPIFLADAHLGGLARFLRMLGFDTLHDNGFADADIRRIAQAEPRIVLSRDRELLKCRDIARGAYVRARRAEAQLREVAERFALAPLARPFTRCLVCNAVLQPVAKAEVAERLPDQVREIQETFTRCGACGRIYWPGSHYARMRAALDGLLRA